MINGNLNEDQRRKLVKGGFFEFWQDTFSLLPTESERAALKRVDLHGLEHLHRAWKEGRGTILWESSYFGRRTLTNQILRMNGFSIHQIHAENHVGGFLYERSSPTWVGDHVIKPFFEKCEKNFVKEIIYLSRSDSLAFTRILLSRLKQNGILCVSGEGKFGRKQIPLNFLGRTRLFPTGMVSLAKISGASILPVFCIQEKNSTTRLIIESPIDIKTNLDRESGLENSVRQYVNLLESYIRKYPEQYRNWSRSF